jgi:hypothetical protein
MIVMLLSFSGFATASLPDAEPVEFPNVTKRRDLTDDSCGGLNTHDSRSSDPNHKG